MTKKNKICFATNNRHKLSEVANLLSGSFDLVGLADVGCEEELAEDFFTLEENSLQKAEYIFKKFQIACFSDDTGLEVQALNGEPGVHSAYFAGPQRNRADNMALLLQKLGNTTNRHAQFRTVITLIEQSGARKQFEGVVRGQITFQPRGAEGFGYDPIFLPDGFDKTLAEMTMEEKNKISHRAVAVNRLVEYLNARRG